jgi:Tfp pilus assembly protein PilV
MLAIHPLSQRRRRAGFTILEVMMAASVMVLAITTSITTMQRGFATLDSARNLTLAGQIMVCEMEKIRMLDWTTVSGSDYMGTHAVSIDASFTDSDAATRYANLASRFTLSRLVETAGSADMLKITVTITWKNYDGRTISRSYMTYYARYGIHDYLYTTA